MRILTEVIISISIIIALITIIMGIYISNVPIDKNIADPVNIQFKENTYIRTLTVEDINYNFDWESVNLVSGLADLPSGSIKKGDVITDCYGIISLYLGYDILLGVWDFGDESEYEEEMRFSGVWSPEIENDDSSYDIIFSTANSYNIKKSRYKEDNNITIDIGRYRAANDSLILSKLSVNSYSQVDYHFSDDYSKLVFNNWSWDYEIPIGVKYKKTINATQTFDAIIKDAGQKVLITGIITNTTNETTAYMVLDDSELNVKVSFENYTEENISKYIDKQLDIIGFIYTVDSDDLWYKAIIKEIESIEIIE